MEHMILFKIPLLILGAICSHISFTNPNASVKVEESQKYDGGDLLTRIHRGLMREFKLVIWGTAVCETLVLLAARYPSRVPQQILDLLTSRGSESVSHIRFTPVFFTGLFLQVFCGIVRLVCYRTLGRHFTFALTVRENHKLITTGPYSIVRHPSYIAAILGCVGMPLVQLGDGSWWATCGASTTLIGQIVAVIWLASVGSIPLIIQSRVKKEDNVLRQEFGAQWEKWANQTPYRLIPGIY